MPLVHLGIVDSTQSFLARHPELGHCGVLADEQTAGRGRGGNSWVAERGAGLWLSARLPKPEILSGIFLQYAMAAVAEVLEPCGVRLGLKWPNDLVAYREPGASLVKIGGIIGEQKDDYAILGLGLNIFGAPEMPERPIPPASMSSLGAVSVPKMVDLARAILSAWQDLGGHRAAFRWPEEGDPIYWEEGSGVCQGWESDGRLAVLTESGQVLLTAGDICGIGIQSLELRT
ncbi:MAG: hypothetical protein FWG12_02770 [Holophagaceae bacterium]|nr:hypothetical protein [Holophagaceae bacterium]